MKRKGNLYPNIYLMKNIIDAFEEVCRNTKNKRRVYNFKQYRSIYISRIYNTLKIKPIFWIHVIFLQYMNLKNVEL